MQNIIHRQYLTLPGEGLLLIQPDPDNTDGTPGTPAFAKMTTRLDDLARDTTLDTNRFISTPLTAVPIPLYPAIEEGNRRWEGLNPELMWHPLMWLPDRLAYPYLLTDTDEEGQELQRLETTEELSIRIMLELTQANLYNPTNAGWVDVLALHDLDATDPSTLHRIDQWLQGKKDPQLDAINLDPYITDTEDPDWAIHVTHEIYTDVVCASWHIIATDIAHVLREARESKATPDDLRRTLTLAIELASTQIGDAVITPELNLAQRLEAIIGAMPYASDAELSQSLYQDTLDALTVVSQAYSQNLDLLQNLGNE